MNALVFFDFLDWMYSRYDNMGTYLTKLIGADKFSVDVLSDKTRTVLLEKAKQYDNINAAKAIEYYIDYISGRVAEPNKFKLLKGIDHMKKLDQVRKTDCTTLFNSIIELENSID